METYKQKYENALEYMRKVYPTLKGVDKEDAEHHFPELKENNWISKEICDFIRWATDRGSITKEQREKSNSWLAWLEKQSKQKQLYIRFGEIPTGEKSKIYQGEVEVGTENGVSVYPAFKTDEGDIVLGLSLPITKTTLYTQQHLIVYDDRPCYLVKGDYVGKDTDGQPLINNISIIEKIDGYRVKEETQSEQKPADKVEPKFKVGDCIRRKGGEVCYRIVTIDDYYYFCENNHAWAIKSQDYFEFVDQNPVDKVEPKFKVGDWIVSECDNVAYIESISKTKYDLQCIDGYHEKMSIDYVDRCWRLWSIQDAKAGDVLADGNLPFIFQEIDIYKYIYAYCGITVNYDFKIESEGEFGEWTWMQDIKPATKEQCDFLLHKMHEAGYEWDAEKKELKEIE